MECQFCLAKRFWYYADTHKEKLKDMKGQRYQYITDRLSSLWNATCFAAFIDAWLSYVMCCTPLVGTMLLLVHTLTRYKTVKSYNKKMKILHDSINKRKYHNIQRNIVSKQFNEFLLRFQSWSLSETVWGN